MIKKFNEEEPKIGRFYDVFGKKGDYLGYLEYTGYEWRTDIYADNPQSFLKEDTYYSDDHDDWLRMLEGLIEIQNNKK